MYIVSVNVYPSDINDIDKVNEVYKRLMADPKPARVTVEVGHIRNGKIENLVQRNQAIAILGGLLLLSWVMSGVPVQAQESGVGGEQVWRFDQTSSLGGYATKVLGHPQMVETPYGKAVLFNGRDDALFTDVHPLTGAKTWTWEVIFRPDEGGAAEQRFFHLSVLDPATGTDTNDRMLFEIRTRNGEWCLDSFVMAQDQSKTLLNCRKLHPLGKWYRVTAVYDGKMLKNYVGGELQGEGEVHLSPQGAGHSSVGVRINLQDYFKGAIFEARFTERALAPEGFLKMPEETAGK
jgi:enamine deaminase RidA (YjgF/YER057c/UK114 family)